MRFACSFIIAAVIACSAVATEYATPPPTFDPNPFTTWNKLEYKGSKRAQIKVPFTNADGSEDSVEMIRLDLVGNSRARGYAHGYLLAKGKINYFIFFELFSPSFYN